MIEAAWERVNIYDGPDVFRETLLAEPPYVRTLVCVQWCDSEVCNGGFDQFFFNGTGVLAPEAEAGFRTVGRPDLADLLQDAMAELGGHEYPRDRATRQAVLEAVSSERLEELQERYFDVLEGGGEVLSLYDAMDKFAQEHRGP
ncbi:MAG: DUF4375 domain-containing protein [Planctomycetota bacterium]